MSLLNIGGGDDPAYRYKMPRAVGKVEGRGNGIKTVLVNSEAIAKSLKRPPEYLVKYCAVELGAQSKYDKATGMGTVNGCHDTPVLQQLVNKFIDKFVLCPKCKLPETVMVLERNQTVTFDCKACGYNGPADMRHKLMTFVIKNPPNVAGNVPGGPGGKVGKSTKEERRKGKKGKNKDDEEDEDEGANVGPPDESPRQEVKQVIRQPERVVDEDDWSMDVSEAAVEARRKEIESVGMEDDEKKREAIADRVEDALDGKTMEKAVEALKDVRDDEGLSMTDVLGFVFEACFDEDILKQIKSSSKLLIKVIAQCPDKMKAQLVLLLCVEMLCCQTHPELEKKVPLVLKGFYDTDVLEEEAILKWADKKPKGAAKEAGKKARAAAAAFITWLKEADDDSEEEESD